MNRRMDIRMHEGEINKIQCPNPDCDTILDVPQDIEKPRFDITCSGCNDKIRVRIMSRTLMRKLHQKRHERVE